MCRTWGTPVGHGSYPGLKIAQITWGAQAASIRVGSGLVKNKQTKSLALPNSTEFKFAFQHWRGMGNPTKKANWLSKVECQVNLQLMRTLFTFLLAQESTNHFLCVQPGPNVKQPLFQKLLLVPRSLLESPAFLGLCAFLWEAIQSLRMAAFFVVRRAQRQQPGDGGISCLLLGCLAEPLSF